MAEMNDELLHEAVVEAVEDAELVRQSKAPVAVTVENGVVTVEAVVMSGHMKTVLLNQVAAVPGVVKVIDKVYEDRDIEITAARALAEHDALDALRPPLIINSYKGVLTISGYVPEEALIDEALRIGEGIGGVRRVRSEIKVGQGAI
jgi:osmotically-inducible protein OsmY